MSRRYRSSDPATLSHIERQYFVNATAVEPGGCLHYGSWESDEQSATRCAECYGRGTTHDRNSWREIRCPDCRGSGRVRAVPITLIDLATWSDYSGSLVEKSNARCLKDEFPWLVEVYGSHGTRGLAYLGKRENQNPALLEAIDSLTDYPIYSDDDHSDLEWEESERQWSEAYGGRHDFKRALCEHFDKITDPSWSHDLDDEAHDPAVDNLWRDVCEVFRGGEEHLNESGETIYFPIDQVMKQISDPRFADYLDRGPYSGDRGTIREQMTALSDASRVQE